jgi:hypothetical protein
LGRHGAGLEYAAMRTPGLGRHREWPAAAFAAASAPFSVQSNVPMGETEGAWSDRSGVGERSTRCNQPPHF